MSVRGASERDWPNIWPWLQRIFAAGDTFAFDPAMGEDEAKSMWLADRTTVALDESGQVVGSAKMSANRPGPGAHIATASYAVNPDAHGHGYGRRLVEESLGWAREEGFRGMQFNAVVESNIGAVRLYESLGFTVVGTVPGAFLHPELGYVGLHVMFCDFR